MEYTGGKRPVAPGLLLEGRWRLIQPIGKGAMGVVFRGVDLQERRGVAVKFLAAKHCDKPNVLARFEREARLMTTLRHPNIIRLYDVGRYGVQPYIVMPFLRGLTLAQVLEFRQGRLSCGEALAVVGQMAAGLSFIHHHGLVHRDIKPQNVFVSQKGRVIILDLGVARDKADPGLTKPGTLVGTPYYMAPEQIGGTAEVDKRTDVYALAAMTFELLVGRPPFVGADPFEILQAHKHEAPPDASRLSSQVSREVAREISCALAKNKAQRPQSASEFYANLKVLIDFHAEVDLAEAFPFLKEAPSPALRRGGLSSGADTASKTPLTPSPKYVAPCSAALETFIQASPAPSPPSVSPRGAALETFIQASPKPSLPSVSPCSAASETFLQDAPGYADKNAGQTPFIGETPRSPHARGPLSSPSLSSPSLPEGLGELRVVSTHQGVTTGAQLWLDGKAKGEAPTSLLLPPGVYLLRLVRAHGPPVERRMRLRQGQRLLCRVDLP